MQFRRRSWRGVASVKSQSSTWAGRSGLRLVSVFVASLALSGGLGCAESADTAADQARCERYRDHAIDIRLRSTDGPGLSASVLERHRGQLVSASGPALVEQCLRFSAARLDCSMTATNQDELHACAEARATN
jgi:hypothetical protein